MVTQYDIAEQVRGGTLELDLINWLAQKYPLKDISVEEPKIEAIVQEIYQRGIDE